MKVSESPALFVGVLGLGLIQVVDLYESTAPTLQDLRSMTQGHVTGQQQLLDADIIIGSTTGLVAISAAMVMHSVWPIVFLFGGFLLVSFWHHMVLNAPNNTKV